MRTAAGIVSPASCPRTPPVLRKGFILWRWGARAIASGADCPPTLIPRTPPALRFHSALRRRAAACFGFLSRCHHACCRPAKGKSEHKRGAWGAGGWLNHESKNKVPTAVVGQLVTISLTAPSMSACVLAGRQPTEIALHLCSGTFGGLPRAQFQRSGSIGQHHCPFRPLSL